MRHTCCVYTLVPTTRPSQSRRRVTSIITHLSVIRPVAELRPLTLTLASLSPELLACITSSNQTMIQSCLDYRSSTDLTAAFSRVDKLLFHDEGRKILRVLQLLYRATMTVARVFTTLRVLSWNFILPGNTVSLGW